MPMTFTVLTGTRATEGSIRNWVNNPTVPAADILTDAENDIFLRLRTREMRAVATITLPDATEYASLPADFLDPRWMKDRYKRDIHHVDWDALEQSRDVDTSFALIEGEPSSFAIFNSRLEFDCKADGEQTFRLGYFAKPAALSVSNETNWLTSRYSMLLRAACCKHAAIFLKDDTGRARYETQFIELLETVKRQDDLSYAGAYFPER